MKKSELFQKAAQISIDVLQRNQDLIDERVNKTFSSSEEDTAISLVDAVGRAVALTITLAPDLSAAITAQMLIDLGLVEIEDDE